MNYVILIYNKNETFDFFENVRCWGMFGNVFVYCWCVLYYKLLFLLRFSDSVTFSVYMNRC